MDSGLSFEACLGVVGGRGLDLSMRKEVAG